MSHATPQYRRFTFEQRFEHGLLFLSFTLLALTGLPQKYSDTFWGDGIIHGMGGIEIVRLIHRSAATLLMLETIYHIVRVSYKVWVMRVALTMLPGWQDGKDALHTLGYNLHFAKTPPRMGRYTFTEKVEYWSLIWGTLIMVSTGFILWNPIAATHFLPGQFIPAAKAAHGGEALLAVLTILTWHLYSVHIKHFNRSMFTGWISQHEMEVDHSLELQAMDSHQTQALASPFEVQRRRRMFVPLAAVISLALLVGLYLFVTFEQTAINTVPKQDIEIFVPLTPTP